MTHMDRMLVSFFRNFLEDDCVAFRTDINLASHADESGMPVTDATIQEIANLIPGITALHLTGCTDVTNVGLMFVDSH